MYQFTLFKGIRIVEENKSYNRSQIKALEMKDADENKAEKENLNWHLKSVMFRLMDIKDAQKNVQQKQSYWFISIKYFLCPIPMMYVLK